MGAIALAVGIGFAVLVILLYRIASYHADIDLDLVSEGDIERLVQAGERAYAVQLYQRIHEVNRRTAREAIGHIAAGTRR